MMPRRLKFTCSKGTFDFIVIKIELQCYLNLPNCHRNHHTRIYAQTNKQSSVLRTVSICRKASLYKFNAIY